MKMCNFLLCLNIKADFLLFLYKIFFIERIFDKIGNYLGNPSRSAQSNQDPL